jgi:hypothetical protein
MNERRAIGILVNADSVAARLVSLTSRASLMLNIGIV